MYFEIVLTMNVRGTILLHVTFLAFGTDFVTY